MVAKIIASLLLIHLTACASETSMRGFKPPPSIYESFVKNGISPEGVKQAMLECGYPNPFHIDRHVTINDSTKWENCMFANGFRYKSGYKGTCSLRNSKDIAACQEAR